MPVATLNRVEADDFSWNVPGLREELVTSLIRSLPKNLRVSFVPAPNKAREFLAAVPPGEEPLLDALERWMRSTTGVVVPREAWDWSKIAPHLQPTYRVLSDDGAEQARGKDLEALKAPLRPQFESALAAAASESGLARTGATSWVFGEIPESETLTRAGHRVTVHPALVDEGSTVGLAVFGTTDEAAARHRLGLRRLLLLSVPLPSDAALQEPLSLQDRLGLVGSPYASVGGAARGQPGRGRRRPRRRSAAGQVRGRLRRAGRRGRGPTPSPRCVPSSARWCGCSTAGGPSTSCSAGAPRWACSRRWPT